MNNQLTTEQIQQLQQYEVARITIALNVKQMFEEGYRLKISERKNKYKSVK